MAYKDFWEISGGGDYLEHGFDVYHPNNYIHASHDKPRESAQSYDRRLKVKEEYAAAKTKLNEERTKLNSLKAQLNAAQTAVNNQSRKVLALETKCNNLRNQMNGG